MSRYRNDTVPVESSDQRRREGGPRRRRKSKTPAATAATTTAPPIPTPRTNDSDVEPAGAAGEATVRFSWAVIPKPELSVTRTVTSEWPATVGRQERVEVLALWQPAGSAE
jgi:hypothetical protein